VPPRPFQLRARNRPAGTPREREREREREKREERERERERKRKRERERRVREKREREKEREQQHSRRQGARLFPPTSRCVSMATHDSSWVCVHPTYTQCTPNKHPRTKNNSDAHPVHSTSVPRFLVYLSLLESLLQKIDSFKP
jgi:hypothetical protein